MLDRIPGMSEFLRTVSPCKNMAASHAIVGEDATTVLALGDQIGDSALLMLKNHLAVAGYTRCLN